MANESLRSLSTLRTAVRANLDEATAAFWTNAQLLIYLNRSKNRVWREVRKLKEDFFLIQRTSTDGALTILGESYTASSFAIVAGTRTYTLPPDFVEMKLIEVTTSGYEFVRFQHLDLAKPEHRALRRLTDQYAPSVFIFDLIGSVTMTIAPLSNTALDLRLSYIRRIADLADDTDVLDVPYELADAVEAYATAAALKQDRAPEAATWEATGREIVASAIGSSARQITDPVFVDAFLGEWEGW